MAKFSDGHLHVDPSLLPHLNNVRCIANACSPQEFHFLQSAGLPLMAISAGIHPWNTETTSWESMEPCLRHADAIGEIGLDSVWCNVTMDVQRAVFRAQLELACKLEKPVVLHTKGMEQEVLETIRLFPNRYLVHWYSCASWLEDYLDLGCWFTVGPSVATDPAVAAVAQHVPTNRLLLESDGLEGICWAQGASLEPADYPAAMQQHLNTVATLRGVAPNVLARTTETALQQFLLG